MALAPQTGGALDPPPPPALPAGSGGDAGPPASDRMGGALDVLGARMANIEGKASERIGKLESEAEALQPPKMQLPPQPQTKATDPMHEWTSAAMTLAALGSLLTRRPLVTAMNAAAGVLSAYRKGDQEAADAAYHTWQTATKNAIEVNNFELDAYKTALGGIERRERAVTQQATAEERAAVAEFQAQAKAFQDDTAFMAAQTRGIEGAQRIVLAREAMKLRLEMALPKLEENRQFKEAYDALQQTPEYQNADPMQQYQMVRSLQARVAPKSDTHGDGSDRDLRAASLVYGREFPTNKVTGQPPPGSPKFQDWYENTWPTWGHPQAGAGGSGGGTPGDGGSQYLRSIKADQEHIRQNIAAYKAARGGQVAEGDDGLRRLEQELHVSEVQEEAIKTQWKANPKATLEKALGVPVQIKSGFRTPEQNKKAGGVPNSAHLIGDAFDFAAVGMTMEQAGHKLAASGIPFDQIEITPNHVHVSFAPTMRGQVGYGEHMTARPEHLQDVAQHPANPPAKYAKAEDVRDAVHAGRLSREEGARILKEQFGMT